MKKRTKWELVGFISVDAGCIQVGDPCYGESDWQSYASSNLAEIIPHEDRLEVAGKSQGFGKAAVIQSGFGDGVYGVEVKQEDGRVKEMRIKFF